MSVQFYPLQVSEVRRETLDTVSIAFTLLDQDKAIFQFTQGQYLTLKTTIEGEEVRRSYSICTGAQDDDLRVAVKLVAGGYSALGPTNTSKRAIGWR